MSTSDVSSRKRRVARTTTLKTFEPPRAIDLFEERIQNERVKRSAAMVREVGVYARANGLTMPAAWGELVKIGLKAQKEAQGGTTTIANA